MRARVLDYPPHESDPVGTAVERHRRLVQTFLRQRCHTLGIDVRRIADDDIVARIADGREQIALLKRNARIDLVVGDVARGDIERIAERDRRRLLAPSFAIAW
ncbi:MAG: hypothetical protein QM703_02270 [Gemmatales bacterium]